MTTKLTTPDSVLLVFYYRKTARYAFNVLTAALEKKGLLKQITLAFPPNKEKLLDIINNNGAKFKKIVVAWSFYSPDFETIKQELQFIHSHTTSNHVIHLAGGVHATAVPLEVLATGFNFVAVGEGEQTICEFMNAMLCDKPVNTLQGINSFDRGGKYIQNKKGAVVDLDAFPACPTGLRKFGPIEITRGCIYACRFCQTPHINKARFRHRSIERIIETVKIMVQAGLRDYRFITPTALSYGSSDESVNFKALEQLLQTVRAEIGPQRRLFYGTFPSEVRPEHVTERVLALLKQYVDNDNLIIGAQSGSQSVLDLCRRGHSVESILDAVTLCVKYNFKPNVDLIFGLPGETAADVNATLELARNLIDMGARIHNHTFMPLPGTPFRSSAAGSLTPQTQKKLLEITAQGQAYGNWEKQMRIAKQLADK
ncbi:MAG: TIGR04013 family B12-binding domain/radical SAM domain-containing protein [Gammaproteobacteria bacterium]|nr:TIGR04013 family B12-binding domain/radical SAM domain-containing protein [Gammaproteobacteria bacterium]MDH5799348.1 TIGR04013 family B12-binding domain/radical SAM domain-containing protein [Gammaproteobacteria bacterium]